MTVSLRRAAEHRNVFDTVSFKEIPSRLARARGSLQQLQRLLTRDVESDIAEELQRLLKLSDETARQLRRFIAGGDAVDHEVPPSLSKEMSVSS